MTGIRRAFLVTSLERYLVLAVNFGVIALVSRLLTPAEIGLAVLGTSLLSLAEALRDFGTGSYLIQAREVGHERVRTAFTVMAVVSGLIVALLMVLAGPLALMYGEAQLAPYLRIIALGFLAGPFSAPILALFRRRMRFGAIALVNVLSSIIGACVTAGLVLLGQSFMSFAWGGLACAVAAATLSVAMWPDTSIFRPQLTEWRSAFAFGGTNSATFILNRIYEVLPYLVLGRLQPATTVGLYNRALLLCQLPDRMLLAGVVGVALPALAEEVRQDRGIKQPYLLALSYITAVQWPTLALVALLAHPMVNLLFGPQWLPAVPLVQIVALAQAFAFPAPLTYPALVALGAVRDTLTSSLISLPISAAILLGAAVIGVEAIALCLLVVIPLQVLVALYFVQRRVHFEWRELGVSVVASAATAACSAVAPVLALTLNGFRLDIPLEVTILAVFGWATGWALGLRLFHHPFIAELRRVLPGLRSAVSVLPLLGGGRSAARTGFD
ncbi:MAG: oligosaccharide flippase family protein [Acetobacteraceae bacterium]|nr:oligosaccharide flippase family protein [Acetobacteraceae bacterium]